MNSALLPFQCHKNSSRVTAIKVTHKTTAKVTTPTPTMAAAAEQI